MKLYLIINNENEPYVVNICNSKEVAELLTEEYEDNFRNGNKEIPPFDICEIDTDISEKGVVFDAYRYMEMMLGNSVFMFDNDEE